MSRNGRFCGQNFFSDIVPLWDGIWQIQKKRRLAGSAGAMVPEGVVRR
jgi:hypothetical protein